MQKISKPLLRRAAAIAKEIGVAVKIEADGTIIYMPAPVEPVAPREVAA